MTAAASQWCLVGNIVERRPHGVGGVEEKSGAPHFAPGAKVYCLPPQWGDGYDKIMVVGRHRGSKLFVKMVIRSAWVTGWRAKVVYSPEVLRLLNDLEPHQRMWTSREEVEGWVAGLAKGAAPDGSYKSP